MIRKRSKPLNRALSIERLEDRLTPTISDKALGVPVDLATLATTPDVLALTHSTHAVNDLRNLVDHWGLAASVDVAGSRVVLDSGSATLLQIHLKAGANARQLATTLLSSGLYSFTSPNYIYPTGFSGRDLAEAIPNDPGYGSQYPHGIIDSPRAWVTTQGNSNVTVAILDDGLDLSHPDLQQNIWTNLGEIAGDGIDNDGNGFIDDRNGYNFLGNNGNVRPDSNTLDQHGTQLAGAIAARIDNSLGVAGLAGRSKILPLKVIGNGQTTSLMIAQAVSYAVEAGVKVINSSLNIDSFTRDPVFQAAVSHAFSSGVLWVNSAGNLNLQDPARTQFTNMLIVGATDRNDAKASYSNYGWGLDISAPGGSAGDPILTTVPGGGYGGAFGTSMAAAYVSATAALLWSANPAWNRDQVASAILANADQLNSGAFLDKLGTGRLDAGESVSGGPFVTRLGQVYDMPGPGQDAPPGFDSFRLRLQGNLDTGTVNLSNFELRAAGDDNLFDTMDDRVISLSLPGNYEYGTNSLDFTIDELLGPGLHRFTAKSGGLRDPFGTPVDGDNNGSAGGDLVKYFGNPLRHYGTITIDTDDSGSTSPGDPAAPPGVGIFPDFNNNGVRDQTTFPSQGAPVAIPDNPDSSAQIHINASGFTRPVNYLKVRVEIAHAAPSDLVISLIAPTGQRVVLFANRPVPGGNPAATQVFNFEDGIAESTVITPNLITRNLNPDQPLSTLYGLPANGTWIVEVTDTTPGDSGLLVSAALTIGEEPLIRTNRRGEFVIGELPPGDVTLRVEPPPGYEVDNSGYEANGLVIGQGRNAADPINVSLVPLFGIIGKVHDAGQGVGGFTVFLDANNNSVFDSGERSTLSDEEGFYLFEGLAAGTYRVALAAQPGYSILTPTHDVVVTDTSPLSFANDFEVDRDTAPVVVDLDPVSPGLRRSEVDAIDFTLSEPVENLNLSHIRLSRDGVNISLADATLIGSGTQFTLIGLKELTGTDGTYTLTVLAPAPTEQPGREPVPAATTWTLDATPPEAVLLPVTNPKGVVETVGVQFNSPVNGLDLTDFVLKRGGMAVPLTGVSLTPGTALNSFVLTGLLPANKAAGSYTLELKPGITDMAGNPMPAATLAAWVVPPRPVKFTAVGTGEGSLPTVVVYDGTGAVVRRFEPFDLSYTGGVRTAVADVNGDLVDDIIVAPGRGSGPRVKVYDGATGLVINDFLAFEANFRGGVFVAAGDITGDGIAEIIVTPDKSGGPRVRVLNGMTAETVADFFGINDVNFRGGARAALGDVTGDGRNDLIVSAGTGGGPRIAMFEGFSVAANTPVKPFGDFFAFESNLRNGAYVTAEDLNGDGFAEIIAGAGDGGGPRLTAYSGAALMQQDHIKLADFFIGDVNTRGGLRMAVKDIDDDGVMDLFVGPGAGVGSRIRVYAVDQLDNPNPAPVREFDPFGGFLGGVYLG